MRKQDHDPSGGNEGEQPNHHQRLPQPDLDQTRALARGSQLGLVSIVSAVSATFPLVVIAGGVILLRERPTGVQWAGVVCTITGLVLLGLGQ